MQRDEDFDTLYDFNKTTDGHNSFQTGTEGALEEVSQGFGATAVSKDDFEKCASSNRNLYITITRIKDSTQKVNAEAFLSEESRMLQGPSPFINFYDLELGFYSIQGGNAKLLGALSFALFAVISVFAF